MIENKLKDITEASDYIKLSESYLRELDRKGVLVAYRDDKDKMWYTKEILDNFQIKIKYAILNDENREYLEYYLMYKKYEYDIVESIRDISREKGYTRFLAYRIVMDSEEKRLRGLLNDEGVYLEIYTKEVQNIGVS